jgi:hypothetical protein
MCQERGDDSAQSFLGLIFKYYDTLDEILSGSKITLLQEMQRFELEDLVDLIDGQEVRIPFARKLSFPVKTVNIVSLTNFSFNFDY